MAGRKPKPTWLKIVHGNPGGRRLNRDEPKPVGDLKEAPDWMTPGQKEGWDYAIKYAPRGLLKCLDRSVLAVWVVAEDTHRRAAVSVEKAGLLTKTRNGEIIQNPFLPVQNKQAVIMLRAAAELGFTPSSRSRITLAQDDGPTRFSEFSDQA